jgi:hypothetical protein
MNPLSELLPEHPVLLFQAKAARLVAATTVTESVARMRRRPSERAEV